ncbi:hypothetical protein HPB50_018742 [Hyalomma asiaticum]|uniref:Uncharacterized protein n=1 Tax=Hyalomma asiaticum TaxID=266040 RepID=A0ACB7TBA5_HYAAI|nr:hypothetical protein HPB50_018742 [Hyalomma asiaticum]
MSHLSNLFDQMVEAELEMKDRLLNNIAQFTAELQKLFAELGVASPEVYKNFLFGHAVELFTVLHRARPSAVGSFTSSFPWDYAAGCRMVAPATRSFMDGQFQILLFFEASATVP